MIYHDELKATLAYDVFARIRMKLIRSLCFRMRLRAYAVSPLSEAERVAVERVVASLPMDPNIRTWSRRNAANVLGEVGEHPLGRVHPPPPPSP